MSHLDALQEQVTATKAGIQSAIVFMNGLAAKLEEFKNDPATIANIAAELKQSSGELAAAIEAVPPV